MTSDLWGGLLPRTARIGKGCRSRTGSPCHALTRADRVPGATRSHAARPGTGITPRVAACARPAHDRARASGSIRTGGTTRAGGASAIGVSALELGEEAGHGAVQDGARGAHVVEGLAVADGDERSAEGQQDPVRVPVHDRHDVLDPGPAGVHVERAVEQQADRPPARARTAVLGPDGERADVPAPWSRSWTAWRARTSASGMPSGPPLMSFSVFRPTAEFSMTRSTPAARRRRWSMTTKKRLARS